MWKQTYSTVTNKVSAAQMWELFTNVNNWHTWDTGIEYAKMDGEFKVGNHFMLRPKGGPEVKVVLTEVKEPVSYTDVTKFPLAKMYDEHRFEQTPEGLKITGTITVTGLLSFLWVKLVAQKIIDDLPADMQRQIEAAAKL